MNRFTTHRRRIALLAVLALALSLLAGCGGNNTTDQPDDPPAANDQQTPQQPDSQPDPQPAPGPDANSGDDQPDGGQSVQSQPNDEQPPQPQPADQQPEQPAEDPPESEPQPTEDPKPAESQPTETAPEQPDQPPQEEQPAQSGTPADGTYTVSVTLAGGSGRASVESPCKLRCEGGQMWATIVWSSSNFDYMKVDAVKYDLISTEGNSTFEIPVAALDQPLPVIADTVAMSEPHEVEYTMTFDSASLTQA